MTALGRNKRKYRDPRRAYGSVGFGGIFAGYAEMMTQSSCGPTKENIATLEGHTSSVYSVYFRADGTVQLIGTWRRSIATLEGHTSWGWHFLGQRSLPTGSQVKLWDIRPSRGHTDWVYSVVFSPDGTTLASASADDTVKLWDVATKENIDPRRAYVLSIRWYFRRWDNARFRVKDGWSSCGT